MMVFVVSAFTEEETTTTTTTTDVIYNQGDISLDAGVDYVTKYFFRGLLVEDDGYIVQPHAQINFHVVSGCDVEFTLFTGMWASLHGDDVSENNAQDPEVVNEFRFMLGAELDLYDMLTVTTTYMIQAFPNGVNTLFGDEDIHEINVLVELHDGAITKSNFSINPFMMYSYQLHDSNPNANNFSDESAFFLFGVKPTIAVNLMPDVDLAISIPVTIGMGGNNNAYVDAQGDGHTYGFTSVGLQGALPLWFIPKRFGSWNFVAGVDVYFLGEAAEDNNPEGGNGNQGNVGEGDGEEFDMVGRFGINLHY